MFLLALGGDSGPTSSKKSTVEKAQLDIFGNLNPWQNVDTLPAPLIWHGAVTIGKYAFVCLQQLYDVSSLYLSSYS